MHLSNFFEICSLRVSPLKTEAETGFGCASFIDSDSGEEEWEKQKGQKELSKDVVSAGV